MALAVERSLRRVEIFRPSLLVIPHRAPGKRNHSSTLVRNGKHDPLAEPVVDRPPRPVVLLFAVEQSASPQSLIVGQALQPVAQTVEVVRRVANAEFLYSFLIEPAPRQVFARHRAFGPAQLLFKPRRRRFMQLQQLAAQPRFGRLLRRRILHLRQRNPALLRHRPHRFRKRHVLNLAHKRKHVARNSAPEAVKKLPYSVHVERAGFFFMERTQPHVVRAPGLAQANVPLDNLHDVGLLLHVLGKIDHGWGPASRIALQRMRRCGSRGKHANRKKP